MPQTHWPNVFTKVIYKLESFFGLLLAIKRIAPNTRKWMTIAKVVRNLINSIV
jgi:hypothetical protein